MKNVRTHETYDDRFYGSDDLALRRIFNSDDEESRSMKRILLNVINNELTARQKEIIVLYYFKKINTVRIAEMLGITQQAVSAAMTRGKLRLFRYLQYYK